MESADGRGTPVKAKALLIDPASMTVVWMNESAANDLPEGVDPLSGVPVDRVVPLAEASGVPQALRDVAETGVPRHLRLGQLVSTARAGLAVVASIYRLPDGRLLMLIENALQVKHGTAEEGVPRRPRRRGR